MPPDPQQPAETVHVEIVELFGKSTVDSSLQVSQTRNTMRVPMHDIHELGGRTILHSHTFFLSCPNAALALAILLLILLTSRESVLPR